MLFAGLMFITLVIFAIMATTYTYIEREDDLTEEDKGENETSVLNILGGHASKLFGATSL